jgi:hypothetical protein
MVGAQNGSASGTIPPWIGSEKSYHTRRESGGANAERRILGLFLGCGLVHKPEAQAKDVI